MYQEEKAVCHATQVELEKVRESLDFARTKDAEILRLGMELGHLKKHMERLTHRLGNGEITCNLARDDCRKMGGDCQIDSKILDRLAAYEETGLEPEEIDRILDAYGRGMTLRTENAQRLEIVKDIKTTRLRELAQADKEGRCVVLPCHIGDPVYMGTGRNKITGYEEDICDGFYVGRDGVLQVKAQNYKGNHGTYGVIGRTAELTREAAEAALRREQDG